MTGSLSSKGFRSHGVLKRRSSRACQNCRQAKTKCELDPEQSQCRRCIANSSPCSFPVSRRGRIRGSRNRRTLEKLQTEYNRAGGAPGRSQPTEDTITGPEDGISSRPVFQHEDEVGSSPHLEESLDDGQRRGANYTNCISGGPSLSKINASIPPGISHQSGTATPWNPHNIIVNGEEENQTHHPALATKLLSILGEFPIEDGKSQDETRESKEIQDPLWLMAGLADHGWDIDGVHSNGKGVKHPISLTSTSIPVEESRLLSKWSTKALRGIEREQRKYFEHGVFGSKFDVARDLDPVQHGLITEEKAIELFQVYWEVIHPQWAMLDPDFHSLSMVRSRSALLTTTLLALGSTALSILPDRKDEQVTEALRLHGHIEKLSLVVYAAGARSIEIIQAQILLCRWGIPPKTRVDEQRWTRAGMITRMASEVGLNLDRRYERNQNIDADKAQSLRLNDLRTKIFIIINEYRFYTYSGRLPTDLSAFEPSEEDIEHMSQLSEDKLPTSVPALYYLYLFDRDVRRRLDQYQPGPQSSLSLDAELEHIKNYIERWIQKWCPGDGDVNLNWHLSHDAISCWLLLAVTVARKRFQSPDTFQIPHHHPAQQQEQQKLLLSLSTRLFKQALKAPQALLMTHRGSIFSFAAVILLRLSRRRDLVLRTALRMAGEPGRPFVPTFVREAGNQMLVVLCSNKLQSRSSSPAPQGNDAGTHATLPTEVEAPPDIDNITTLPGGDQQQNSNVSTPGQRPLQSNGNMQNIQPFLSSGPPFIQQIDGENPFLFNMTDFPCAADLTQPHLNTPGDIPICMPYAPADLDAWIGPAIAQDFANESTPGQNEHLQGLGNVTERAAFFDAGMGIPLDVMLSGHNEPPDSSTWAMDDASPINTAWSRSTGFDRSEQREALLAAVHRLMRLATLMQ